MNSSTLILSSSLLLCSCRMGRDDVELPRSRDERRATPASSARALAKADEDMQAVLERLGALGGKPIESLSATEARRQPTPADAVAEILQDLGRETDFAGSVREQEIPGPSGTIAARVYVPPGEGPFPLVLYVHGGGWVIADLDTYDSSARALCETSEAVVLSTHYRQAPEHRFPAAHEDVFAAYRWAREHASELNADPQRMAVAGESAGGNMAMAISLMARKAGLEQPVHQVLIYPVTSTSLDWPSVEENAKAKPLNKAMLPWFLEKYAPNPADRRDPRLNLMSAELRGLPSTTIVTAEIDPLRSEGYALATRMEEAGVSVEHRDFRGVTHEFFGMTGVVDDADEAQRFVGERLKAAFERAVVAQAR